MAVISHIIDEVFLCPPEKTTTLVKKLYCLFEFYSNMTMNKKNYKIINTQYLKIMRQHKDQFFI